MFAFRVFLDKVQAANDHFEKWKQSSLHDLIDVLARDGTRSQALQAIDRVPFKKQLEYEDALDYVRKQYKVSWPTVSVAPRRVAPPPRVDPRPVQALAPSPAPTQVPRLVAPPPVVKSLAAIARDHGATFHPFAQGDSHYIATSPEGFCAAAALAYVKTKRTDFNRRFEFFSEKARGPHAEHKRTDLIQNVYAGKGVQDQLKVIQSTLGDRYGMVNYGHFENQNVTAAQIYQETYHKGQGHYILFMCVFKDRVDTGNHFMAISIGATHSAFFDPNDGEAMVPNGSVWPLLWAIFSESYLKMFMPDNITSLDRYFKP